MTSFRRSLVLLCSSVLVLPLFATVAGASVPDSGSRSARASAGPQDDHVKAAEAAVMWQRIAVRTIWTETVPLPAPPVGSMYLTFTSLAVHDAASEAQRRGRVAATAAVATAAHDVLWEYFPASRTNLDADLAATMARIPDGKKGDAGAAIGAAAADAMIASRVGDGRFDLSRVYSKAPGVGVWQPGPGAPTTGGGMALAWLGFLKPVVDVAPVALDGHDPLTSPAYAADYIEVADLGSTTSTTRTPEQTAIAQFFNLPTISAAYRLAVCDVLDGEPMGLLPTTRMFARMDAAVLTSFIQTFRLKFDVGFWRPYQAIAGAASDGNPATAPADGMDAAGHQPVVFRLHQRSRGRHGVVGRGRPPDLGRRHRPGPADRVAGTAVRQPDRTRARHPARTHLGWPALPGRHGRRLPPRSHDGAAGDGGDPLSVADHGM